jgi:hypothetical protein
VNDGAAHATRAEVAWNGGGKYIGRELRSQAGGALVGSVPLDAPRRSSVCRRAARFKGARKRSFWTLDCQPRLLQHAPTLTACPDQGAPTFILGERRRASRLPFGASRP